MTTLPLSGRRILVSRAKEQSSNLQQALEEAGAEVIAIPAIEIAPPDSYETLDEALRTAASYHWLIFTSANAVRAVAERAAQLGISLKAFAGAYIAAIGNATANAVSLLNLSVALVPPQAVAESLAAMLAPHVKGKRVLLVRAKTAREVLPLALTSAGATLTIAEAYQTMLPISSVEALRAAFRDQENKMDAALFTSASTVWNLLLLAETAGITIPSTTKNISIGPITTRALEENGMHADAEAEYANMDALVAALISFLA